MKSLNHWIKFFPKWITYIAWIDGSAGGVVSTGLVEHLAKVFLEFAVLSSETRGAVANVEIIQGIWSEVKTCYTHGFIFQHFSSKVTQVLVRKIELGDFLRELDQFWPELDRFWAELEHFHVWVRAYFSIFVAESNKFATKTNKYLSENFS